MFFLKKIIFRVAFVSGSKVRLWIIAVTVREVSWVEYTPRAWDLRSQQAAVHAECPDEQNLQK